MSPYLCIYSTSQCNWFLNFTFPCINIGWIEELKQDLGLISCTFNFNPKGLADVLYIFTSYQHFFVKLLRKCPQKEKRKMGGTHFHGPYHFMTVECCWGGDECHQQVLKVTRGVPFHIVQQCLQCDTNTASAFLHRGLYLRNTQPHPC